jgi:hypothetical protein
MASNNFQQSDVLAQLPNEVHRKLVSSRSQEEKDSQRQLQDFRVRTSDSLDSYSDSELLVRLLFSAHPAVFDAKVSTEIPKDEAGELSALWFSMGNPLELREWVDGLSEPRGSAPRDAELAPEATAGRRPAETDGGAARTAAEPDAEELAGPYASRQRAERAGDASQEAVPVSPNPSMEVRSLAQWWAVHQDKAQSALPWDADGMPAFLADRFVDSPRLRNATLPVVAAIRSPNINRSTFVLRIVELLGLIRAAEGKGERDAEDVTDSLALPLSKVVDVAGPTKQAYQQFLRRLYGLLWRDVTAQETTTSGQIQSMAALGDVSGRIKEDRFLRQAVVIYEAVIHDLCDGLLVGEADKWTRSRIGANNISGFISTLAKFDAGAGAARGDGLKLARLMNRMQCISTIGSVISERFPKGAIVADDWATLDPQHRFIPSTDPQRENFLRDASTMVRAMNNVISAWSYADPEIFPLAVPESADPDAPEATGGGNGESFGLLLTTIGAMVRARYSRVTGEDLDEPSSALFNAALALGRLSKQQTSLSQAESAAGQVTFNALGLYWALHSASTLDIALLQLNGESCLVNLLGSATRMNDEVRTDGVDGALTPVVALAVGWLRNDEITGNERFRIEASLRELLERNRSVKPVKLDRESAKQYVGELWAQTCIALKLKPNPFASGLASDFVGTSLPVQMALIRRVLDGQLADGEPSKFAEVCTTLMQMLEAMMKIKDSNNPLQELAVSQQQSSGGALKTEIRSVLEGLTPAVATSWKEEFEALDRERVKKIELPDGQIDLPTSYTELLETNGALAWLPNVIISERGGAR